jgi:hypothetical protein
MEEDEMGSSYRTHGGEDIYLYKVLVGKHEGKGPLGRPRRRWEHNIKVNLKAIGW